MVQGLAPSFGQAPCHNTSRTSKQLPPQKTGPTRNGKRLKTQAPPLPGVGVTPVLAGKEPPAFFQPHLTVNPAGLSRTPLATSTRETDGREVSHLQTWHRRAVTRQTLGNTVGNGQIAPAPVVRLLLEITKEPQPGRPRFCRGRPCLVTPGARTRLGTFKVGRDVGACNFQDGKEDCDPTALLPWFFEPSLHQTYCH